MKPALRLTVWTAALALLCMGGISAGTSRDAATSAAPVAETVPGPEAPWSTVAASGPVEARPAIVSAGWQPVRRGDELEPRSVVRTGRRGRATLVRHADILIVDPDSQVELPTAALDEQDSSVRQTSGSVIYEVDGGTDRDFRVFTPYLVAGVKGTVFMVTVEEGYASVTVDEGIVEVTSRSTGESLDVRAGESVWLDAREGAEMEHVTLRVRNELGDTGADSRKLARRNARRLARARDDLDLVPVRGLLDEDPMGPTAPTRTGNVSTMPLDEDEGPQNGKLEDAVDELSEDEAKKTREPAQSTPTQGN